MNTNITNDLHKSILDAAFMGKAVKVDSSLSVFGNTFTAYFETDENVATFKAYLPCGLTSGYTKGPKYTQVSVTF